MRRDAPVVNVLKEMFTVPTFTRSWLYILQKMQKTIPKQSIHKIVINTKLRCSDL
jgi:hypothetical protein